MLWEGSPCARPCQAALGVALSFFLCAAFAGCGAPSAPMPPTLNLPQVIRDLRAERTADTVRLTWTMPSKTTDKVPLKNEIRAHICRQEGTGRCEPVTDRPFTPAIPASFADVLPTALATGPPALLTYVVKLENRAGKSAGPSNPAYAASGAAPAPLYGLRATLRPDGVLLEWDGAAAEAGTERTNIQLLRHMVDAPRPEKRTQNAAALSAAPLQVATEQTLLVKPTAEAPNRALDRGALFDHTYQYRAERVEDLSFDGHAVSVHGAPGEPVTIQVQDVFPPAVPAGLTSATDEEAHAIDLSWTPDEDSDLLGYFIYRRDVGTEQGALRIGAGNATAPVPAAAFRDTTAIPGRRYGYSVSAVDRHGNESARSSEVVESLPQ